MHTLQFTSLDWSILIGYVLVLAIAGYASTRRNMENADDYFLASHRAPTWLVAVSVLSTVQSTATFLGVDRKSVVQGKSVSVRVDLGGSRIIKKKNILHSRPQYHDTHSKVSTFQICLVF